MSASTPTTPALSMPETPIAPRSVLAHLSQVEQDALKATVFQRLHPRVYLERYIDEDIRPDGRAFWEFRDVDVNVGSISTADGSALVRMGNTTVICGVKAEIAEPDLDREEDGFLVPNVDLPAMCSAKFKPGPPSEDAQVLSDRLNEVLISSNFLPLSKLCIEKGKAVWVLYVDATCINYDGNAFDATLLAMVAALKNTTLPKAVYNQDTQQTLCYRNASRMPLQLSPSVPISMSFGIFDSKIVLADPTSFEEPLLNTAVTVVLAGCNKIVAISQLGPTVLQAGGKERVDALPECIENATKRREVIVNNSHL